MPQTLKKQALTLTIANGFTRGLGFLFRLMTARLKAYEPVDLTLGRTCERRGIDPLDTAKYILSARKALQESL